MTSLLDIDSPSPSDFEVIDPPKELLEKSKLITLSVFEGLLKMDVPDEISSKVRVDFSLDQILPSPSVRLEKGEIVLDIPLLFLLSEEDLQPTSKIGLWAQKFFSGKQLSKEELFYLRVFQEFSKNSKLAEEAKKFVLYHELAHIFYGHVFGRCSDLRESKEREKQADLKAFEVLRTAVGGIYLFNMMAKFDKRVPSTTHPSFDERVSYLLEATEVEVKASG